MRWRRPSVALILGLVWIGVVGDGPAGAGSPADFPAPRAARLLAERVRADGLDGGVLAVGRDGVWSERATGITAGTVMPIASASKWLTAATLMTLVDEGRLDLDTRVGDLLGDFDGAKARVRVRHLLAHTSGLVSDACVTAASGSTAACTARLAAGSAPTARPGTRFVYSGVGYEVVGRIVEVLTGRSFEAAFAERIASPLGMERTSFVRGGTHPVPSASATSTATDYLRFLAMLAADGVARTGPAAGDRILSAASVAAIEADQVRGVDTSTDGAVRTTGIPTYGLGVWRDVVASDGRIRVVSGNGAFGFYPWIDRRPAGPGTFGVVAVADLVHGSDHAVPRSQRIARVAWREAAGFDRPPPADGG